MMTISQIGRGVALGAWTCVFGVVLSFRTALAQAPAPEGTAAPVVAVEEAAPNTPQPLLTRRPSPWLVASGIPFGAGRTTC